MTILVTFFIIIWASAIITYLAWDIGEFGCNIYDNLLDSDTDLDVILTKRLFHISIFGEPIKVIHTAGTSIKWLSTKNFELIFYLSGKVTIRVIGRSPNEETLITKEKHTKEIEKFKTKFFNRVKVGKTNRYKLRLKFKSKGC